jgi:hypothetical protein
LPFETIDKARISVPIEKMGEIGGQMTYSYYGSNIKSEIE